MGGVKAPGAHRPPGHAIGPRPSRAALLLPAAPAALLVVWRVSRQQCTGRGGADTLVVGRRHGSGRRRTATGTGLRTAPSILSRRTTGCRACSSSRPCSRGGWWAPRRAPSAPHLSTPPSTSAPAGSPAGAHGTAGGCAPAWPSRRCRSPLCRTRPWSQTSGEALGETTRCRGHLRQLENPRGEHWKIGTRAAAEGVSRPSARDQFRPCIRDTLTPYPRRRATRLHAMLRQRGSPGAAVQVRRHHGPARAHSRARTFSPCARTWRDRSCRGGGIAGVRGRADHRSGAPRQSVCRRARKQPVSEASRQLWLRVADAQRLPFTGCRVGLPQRNTRWALMRLPHRLVKTGGQRVTPARDAAVPGAGCEGVAVHPCGVAGGRDQVRAGRSGNTRSRSQTAHARATSPCPSGCCDSGRARPRDRHRGTRPATSRRTRH